MTLPLFPPSEDPGPSFSALVRRVDGTPPALPATAEPGFTITHGTTIVALRFTDGVIMAGDRRATAGSSIAHRAMDKVHPADRWSGVFEHTGIRGQDRTNKGECFIEIRAIGHRHRQVQLPDVAEVVEDLADDFSVGDDHSRPVGVHERRGKQVDRKDIAFHSKQ